MIEVILCGRKDTFADLKDAIFFMSRDDRAPHVQAVIELHKKAARTPAQWVNNYTPFFGVRAIDWTCTGKNGEVMTAKTTQVQEQRKRPPVISVRVS